MLKQSSKLLIPTEPERFPFVWRGEGARTNPYTWSLPSIDGDGSERLAEDVYRKFLLNTKFSLWEKIAVIPNPYNAEINHLWAYAEAKDPHLSLDHIDGIAKHGLSVIWDLRMRSESMISPALTTIMDQAILTQDNLRLRTLFEPEAGYKRTTAHLIPAPNKKIWMVERAEGDFNNAGMISLPGSDDHDMETVVRQAEQRISLKSEPSNWMHLGIASNPQNNELKALVAYKGVVAGLGKKFSPDGHEKGKYKTIFAANRADIVAFRQRGQLSPAADVALRLLDRQPGWSW